MKRLRVMGQSSSPQQPRGLEREHSLYNVCWHWNTLYIFSRRVHIKSMLRMCVKWAGHVSLDQKVWRTFKAESKRTALGLVHDQTLLVKSTLLQTDRLCLSATVVPQYFIHLSVFSTLPKLYKSARNSTVLRLSSLLYRYWLCLPSLKEFLLAAREMRT